MDHIGILKAADDMDDRVGLPDIGEKLIPEALPLGGPLHKPGNIHKFYHRRRRLLGMIELREQMEPFVRHSDNPHIGVYRAKGIVCGLCPRPRDSIKESRFPDIWKTNDS